MTRATFLAALAATASVLAPVAPAQAAPTVVVGSQTISGGEHTFTERIVVTPGSTLTIEDATIYLDQPRSCPIGGTVVVCNPHLFVMAGGTLVARNTTFDTHLPAGPLDPASGYMIYTYSGRLDIEDSTIIRANSVGGELRGPVPSRIVNSTIRDGVQAVSFIRGAEATIEGNTIVNTRFGIDIRDSDSVIKDNYIHVLGYGIDVQSTLVGEKIWSTRALVEGNIVENSIAGFYTLNGYGSVVRNNVFRGNGWAAVLGVNTGDRIVAPYEPIVFEGNTLENNSNGVRAYASVSGGQSEPIELVVPARGNSIVGTACRSAQASVPVNPNVTVVLDARLNWWGSAAGPQSNGPECPATSGFAHVQPWLEAPPA